MRKHFPGVTRPSAGLLALVAVLLGAGCSDQQPVVAPLRSPAAPRFNVGPGPGVYAYVANTIDNTVAVIRTSDNTIVATVPVGNTPFAVAATPDGSKVYVADRFLGHTVSVIQTSDNTVIATVPIGTGNGLGVIAITPHGDKAYVTNSSDNTVSVIRTSDNTVVATIPVGFAPEGVAITPSGDTAYVANLNSNSISVIRTSDNTVVQTVNLTFPSSFPGAIAITPDGSTVYVTNELSAIVTMIRTSDNTVVGTVGVGAQPENLAITPDGSMVYVTNDGFNSNTVSVIQRPGNTVVATVVVGTDPIGVAFSPSGDTAYVTNHEGNNISLIRTTTNTAVQTVSGVGRAPSGIAITTVSAATPTQQIATLQAAVLSLPDLGPGLFSNSLESKLTDALTALNAGEIATACVALEDFISEVAAQSGKKISAAEATTLINQATAIRTQIGC